MFWLPTEGIGHGSAPPLCSGSTPATHDPPALDTIPITSLRSASMAALPPRPQGAVARITTIYTFYVRLQKTRIQAQGELRGGPWRCELPRTGSVLLRIGAAHGETR